MPKSVVTSTIRLLAVMLGSIAFVAGVAACGGDDDGATVETADDATSDSGSDGVTIQAEPYTDPTPRPTLTPTPEPIATPTVTVQLADTAFTNDSKVSTAGIDEIIFGTDAEAAARAASTLWVGAPEGDWPECVRVVPANGPDGIDFWVWAKLIERIDITNPALRTRSGYGVGTQLAQLQEELGELITVADLGDGRRQATFTPSDEFDQYRLVFIIEDGRVTRFTAGRSGIVDLAEEQCGSLPDDAARAAAPDFTRCDKLGLRSVSTDLPGAVRLKAEQMQAAAGTCDFEALSALTAEEFTASYGGGTFEEVYGPSGESMTFLTRLLSLEPGMDPAGNWVWPSAFSVEWAQVTDQMRAELAAIGFTEDEFDAFESFGAYIGPRVGITPAGEWIFFVAGD